MLFGVCARARAYSSARLCQRLQPGPSGNKASGIKNEKKRAVLGSDRGRLEVPEKRGYRLAILRVRMCTIVSAARAFKYYDVANG